MTLHDEPFRARKGHSLALHQLSGSKLKSMQPTEMPSGGSNNSAKW
jgi:hypothetical protein